MASSDEINGLFKLMDFNNSGSVQLDDLVVALKDDFYGRKLAEAIIRNYDKDGNWELDLVEFFQFMFPE
uniref:EF-hand domain-containing protein n=1 Tax=Mesocestoides corti TaxID=53468 RepID=A0A5K3FZM6_MESCO